ncbi:MAG: LlaMI family restriction endonuclease [Methylococcales bacterium]|nr:LlaMI family restriction endonuclease [Methylococcales bacterium]
MTDKEKIIELFNQNVKGKKSDISGSNSKHDGKEGHWLERQMGLSANASNSPDIYGYEMKNTTTSKTTFGDWSADKYIFKGENSTITRDEFLQIFGKPNEKKDGRFSWSGEPCPKINGYNNFGQKLDIDEIENIKAIYSYSEDKRPNKQNIVPSRFQVENLVIALWEMNSLKTKLERKFNQKGWFKCEKNSSGEYESINFGEPINYENWLNLVRKGVVFFDSGMYQTNNRNYSQWRANNSLWDSLITSTY